MKLPLSHLPIHRPRARKQNPNSKWRQKCLARETSCFSTAQSRTDKFPPPPKQTARSGGDSLIKSQALSTLQNDQQHPPSLRGARSASNKPPPITTLPPHPKSSRNETQQSCFFNLDLSITAPLHPRTISTRQGERSDISRTDRIWKPRK